MFSLQGLEAQPHISASMRRPFFTGTRIMRMPESLTSFAAFFALQRFEARPSVTRITTCWRLRVPKTWKTVFALSSALSVIVQPFGHCAALTFVIMPALSTERGEITLVPQLKLMTPYRKPPEALPLSASIVAILDMPIRSVVNFLLSSQFRSIGLYRYQREPLPSSRMIASRSATHCMSLGHTKLL